MAMIKWIITTSQKYAELLVKDSNALYFLQDTQEIYKGEMSFTQPTIMVADFPGKGALGRVYIHQTTLEGKVWTGSEWKTVIQPVAQEITGLGGETTPVSGDAVKDYVTKELTEAITGKFVEGITYDKATKELKYTVGEEETAVGIEGFITNASYSGDTGVLTFSVQGGDDVTVNLPKENFVKEGKYDPITKELVLVLQDDAEVRIPAGDLIDSTEFKSSETVEMKVGEDGFVTADVKVSAEGGNTLVKKGDGLYVAAVDISNKLDKVETAKENEIIVAKADGTVATSGLKAGNATLGDAPDANTLATEAAVESIRAALESKVNTKIDKSAITTTVESSATASDDKIVSERAVAIALEALEARAVAKADITSSVNENAASESKIVSEKAIVDAMSWVTLA